MFSSLSRFPRFVLVLAVLGGTLISAGCQTMRMPWSESSGLPAQWEPPVPKG